MAAQCLLFITINTYPLRLACLPTTTLCLKTSQWGYFLTGPYALCPCLTYFQRRLRMKTTQQMTGGSLWTSVIRLERHPMGKPEKRHFPLNDNSLLVFEQHCSWNSFLFKYSTFVHNFEIENTLLYTRYHQDLHRSISSVKKLFVL